MIDTLGGHYGIILETRKKQDSSILFLEDSEEDLCSYKAVRKVHKVNAHKKKEQMIAAYRNTRWMCPDLGNTIKNVFNECKVCQKFKKSVARPRVSLPK